LSEFPCARSDEVDNQQPDPPASRLPKRGESIAKRIFRPRKQTPGADPGAEQRSDQHIGREVASGDEKVSLVFDETASENADTEEDGDNDYEDNEIEIQQ
jgi:hypothetical protein